MPGFPTRRCKSAQRESNPHIRHGKAVGCRYIMGAWCCFNCQRTINRKSTGSDSNRRHRITGAESSPLDDQCLWSRGSRVESRGPELGSYPSLWLSTLDTQPSTFLVGPEGFEPSLAWLRARCAASNTSVPSFNSCCCYSVGAEGIEPSTCVL